MANLYGQYVWLIDTIRSAGRITKAEIDRRWAKSSLNEKREATYPLRSFHRHKEAIREIFGLIIGCDLSGGYVYYISNFDDLASDGYRSHLLKSLECTISMRMVRRNVHISFTEHLWDVMKERLHG